MTKSVNGRCLALCITTERRTIHQSEHYVRKIYTYNVLKKALLLFEAAAKSLQSCLTLCDPTDHGPPGSPSLELSRQEHWSRLPFPSPMHEREKWKWSRSVVSNSPWPHGLQPTRLLHPWDFPGKSTGVGCHGRQQNREGNKREKGEEGQAWKELE